MKRTESEEHNDFKNAVKGRHIIPICLTFSLFLIFTSAIQTKTHFQEATDMSKRRTSLRVEVFSTNLK